MLTHTHFTHKGLRVILVTPGLSPGGAEIWMSTLARHAQTVRYTAIVQAGLSGLELEHSVANVPIITADNTPAESVAQKVYENLHLGCDLIVYWGLGPMWKLSDVGVPVAQVSHSSAALGENTNDGHLIYVKSIGNSSAHFMAAVSQSAKHIFSTALTRREQVTVVHNGADMERSRPVFGRAYQRAQWQLPPEAKVALFVGRFTEGKNADLLIRALAHLPDEWHAVLYGWGTERDKLIGLASQSLRSYKGKGRVLFPQPRLNHLGDVYAAADVAVLPSQSEAFPLVMIEAWHSMTPLVCSEFQTLFEVEEMYAEGQQLAEHIPLLATSQQLAQGILNAADKQPERVLRAFHVASEHFSASAMVGRWESLFYHWVSEYHRLALGGVTYVCPPADEFTEPRLRSAVPEMAGPVVVNSEPAQEPQNGNGEIPESESEPEEVALSVE